MNCSKLSICSVGDISFQGRFADNSSLKYFSSVVDLFHHADITIANLENPLIGEGSPVPGKCTLRGAVEWASILKAAGINIVSLANNHMMDFGKEGLISTLRALDSAGIYYVGAGMDIDKAQAPIVLDIKGKKIAVFARTSVIVSSPSYADKNMPGVAFLDMESTIRMIMEIKSKVDYLILNIHWGLEEYHYPSPEQRLKANSFVEAGVDFLLGHHPHVLQGIERMNKSIVSYSSGNFFFDEFQWSFINRDGNLQATFSNLSNENRKGMILNIGINDHEYNEDHILTYIDPSGNILIEESDHRKKELERLSALLMLPGYTWIWKAYSIWKEIQLRILPMIAGKLTWSKLKKIRIRHFKQLFSTIKRSSKIASQKSNNPYE